MPPPSWGHALQLKMGGGGTQLFPKYLLQCPRGSDADQERSGFGALLRALLLRRVEEGNLYGGRLGTEFRLVMSLGL